MKKVISLFLSFVMLLSLTAGLDFSAYADTLTTGKCGENVTYSFDSDTGTLTISGTGDMYDYSSSKKSVFYNNKNIKVVIIEKGVTNIGDYIFLNCPSLESVTIPDSVTSIDWSAFENCTSLTSVTIPNSVARIGDYAFRNCTSLTSVTIPDSVTSIGWSAFSNCKSLTSVTIPDGVTSIGNSAFRNCTSLSSVTIADSVTSIGDCAFENCTSLISINVEENNSNYSSVNGVLFDRNQNELICYPAGKNDKNYEIPNSVTSIVDCAFSSCKSLTSVTIPNSVTSIGENSFENCTSLTSVTIPNGVTNIGNSAFYYCTSLTSVTIPDSVTSIGSSVFSNCTSLTSITIPDSVTSIDFCAFYNCTSLTKVTIPDSVMSIGIRAFEFCESLTSVAIPDSVTSIGASAFRCCTSLTSVTIPDGVTSIGDSAFETCTSLISINVEENNINYFSVNGVLFNQNQNELMYYPAGKNDKNYEIPDGVTSIGDYSFYGCKSLTSITIPNSVTNIGKCAFSETSLTSIIVLSANCNFEKHSLKSNVKIYGFENSIANKYATMNGNDFVKIFCNDYGMEHTYSKKAIKNSTCKNSGEISYTCDRCYQSYTETTPALGGEHDYNDEVITQPTCTTKGVTRYTCSRCGDSYDEENLDALGHEYVAEVVTQPTCTTKGITRYTCSRCGDSYDKDDIAALGHEYVSKVVTQPTCTTKGVTRYTCSRCGYSYDKDDIAALGHSYTEKITKNPTCVEEGTKRYDCSRCGDSYTTSVQALGHNLKLTESVEPTLTSDGYDLYECQRTGCDYYEETDCSQLILDYNKKIYSNGTDTYKIEMPKSGYLVFDFAGESESWSVNIYDEDYKKVDALTPQYKEFYKKSYLQMAAGETVPNKNQIVTLFAGTYYVEIERLNESTNDNFSGNYEFSIDYTPSAETINETKHNFYYDAPTAKDISLNKTYNGFLGAKYAALTYSGKDLITADERDAYKFEIPKGSGWSQLSLTLSSKSFGPFDTDCTVTVYNSEFEPCAEFTPLSVSANSTKNEIAYLYEGVYYIAVENRNPNSESSVRAPIEYSFTTKLSPSGTFACVTHRGILTKTKNPTCTKDGYKLYTCQICNAQYKEVIKATGHTIVYDDAVAATCTSSGLTKGSHCSVCGATVTAQQIVAATGHTYKQTVTPATASKDGKIVKKCSVCGAVSTVTIAKASSVSLSSTRYTYNGSVKTPSVTVKNSKGKALTKGKDYTVTYSSGRKNVGKYSVKITFKGNYSGTVTKTFTIKPKATSVNKLTALKGGIKVYVNKQATQTTGYQIQYSSSSSFANAKTATIGKNTTLSKSITGLAKGKKYYVRVRTYKTVNGTKYYSSWSKAKSVTTKK